MKKLLNEDEIFQRFKTVIVNLLQMNREKNQQLTMKINLETDIYKDLGIDSLEAMDLAAAVEKEFMIPINAEEMVRKMKVKDFVSEIAGLQGRE